MWKMEQTLIESLSRPFLIEKMEQFGKWNEIAQALIESLSRPFWWMIYRMRRRDLLLSYLFNLFFEHVNRFPYLYVCFFLCVV